jgi:hypothetical protein
MDAMWISATSSAIPRSRTPFAGDGVGNLVQRGPFGPFVRRRHGRHPVGVDERIRAIQGV